MKQSGFTLIELSIVLIIIGLLVGGILTGRDLIKASEVRSQISQIASIKTAHFAFREKYGCIAGDCSNTSALFGTATSTDGNNDGKVQCWVGAPYNDECRTYFTSLASARLLPADFSLAPTNEYYDAKLNNGLIYTHFMDRYGAHNFTGESAVFLHLFKPNWPSATGGAFSPLEAQHIDRKYDDGRALSGVMFGFNAYLGAVLQTCFTSGDYDLTQTTLTCRMDFKVE